MDFTVALAQIKPKLGCVADNLVLAEAAVAEGITAYLAIGEGPMPLEQAMREAPRMLAATAANVLRILRASSRLQ